jgi:hypothetical protein
MSLPLEAFKSVVLNGSGYGTVTLAPESFRTWLITAINVRTSQTPTQTPVPQVTVYRGSVGGFVICQSYMGNRTTAGGSPVLVQPSEPIVVEWTGGIAGTTATVWLDGSMDNR